MILLTRDCLIDLNTILRYPHVSAFFVQMNAIINKDSRQWHILRTQVYSKDVDRPIVPLELDTDGTSIRPKNWTLYVKYMYTGYLQQFTSYAVLCHIISCS